MKPNKPIIPVKKTGGTKAYYIGSDWSMGAMDSIIQKSEGSRRIQKASTQLTDPTPSVRYETPYVLPSALKSFYEQNPYFFRAIKLKAMSVVGIGWDYVPVDRENEDYLNDANYKKGLAFLNAPNETGESLEEIIVPWAEDTYHFGHGFLECVANGKGELAELYHMRSYFTYISRWYNNITYLQVRQYKEQRFRPLNADYAKDLPEALMAKQYNPFNDYYGYPDGYSATPDLTLNQLALEYNIKQFKNNLMIQFIIVCEGGEIDKESLSEIAKFLQSNFMGVSNAGKVLYLNSDTPEVKIRIEKMDIQVRDMSFEKLRNMARDNVIVAMGLFGRLLNVVTQGQLGGGSEGETQFDIINEMLIRPQKRFFQNKINYILSTKLGITDFVFEFKELTIDKFVQLANAYTQLSSAGILDENESRIGLGWEPKEEETTIEAKLSRMHKELKQIKKSVEQ
jgi:capsid portal protein